MTVRLPTPCVALLAFASCAGARGGAAPRSTPATTPSAATVSAPGRPPAGDALDERADSLVRAEMERQRIPGLAAAAAAVARAGVPAGR